MTSQKGKASSRESESKKTKAKGKHAKTTHQSPHANGGAEVNIVSDVPMHSSSHRKAYPGGVPVSDHKDVVAGSEENADVNQIPPEVLDSVCKVFTTHCDPNYSLPWQMKRQAQSTSTGFVIGNKYILTNAHCVENHTVVKIKKRGSDKRYTAKVLCIGAESDCAILTVEDETFWKGMPSLSHGASPALQSSVVVVGYPMGGENICVTSGVVSRIEIQQYAHSATDLLAVQIDASINAGASGGPALNSRYECVGIAFQSLKTHDTENIGYIIPWLVVDHFLEDYRRNRKYTGFCSCGFSWQKMENPHLRKSLQMKEDESGILVKYVDKTTPAYQVLQKGDIVTHFDGVQISNSGTVPYRTGELILFNFLVTLKFVGDSCKLNILRDGVRQQVEFMLVESTKPMLVPVHDPRPTPEYFTVAGLVFVALSEPYLRSEYGEKWEYEAPVKLLNQLMYGHKDTSSSQVVILSQILNATINSGYEYLANTQVMKFNGVPIENVFQLAKLVTECKDDYLKFELDYDETVVLHRSEAVEASKDILKTHCIPEPGLSLGPVPAKENKATVASTSTASPDINPKESATVLEDGVKDEDKGSASKKERSKKKEKREKKFRDEDPEHEKSKSAKKSKK